MGIVVVVVVVGRVMTVVVVVVVVAKAASRCSACTLSPMTPYKMSCSKSVCVLYLFTISDAAPLSSLVGKNAVENSKLFGTRGSCTLRVP